MMKTFKHSGKLGDIIYSLPTVIALGGGTLYIADGSGDLGISKEAAPVEPVVMPQETIAQMIELLKRQPYLTDVQPYHNQPVGHNLDLFREHVLRSERRGDRDPYSDHLTLRHLEAFNVKFNVAVPWLHNIEAQYLNDIIIGHSHRYFSPQHVLDWKALSGYEQRCAFVGFQEEYDAFVGRTGLNIQYYLPSTIYELARVIKASKLYIGNQSLGFALAEAMKCPRVLESNPEHAYNLPRSMNGYWSLNRKLVEKALQNKIRTIRPPGLNYFLQQMKICFLFEGPRTFPEKFRKFVRANFPTAIKIKRALFNKGHAGR